MLQIIGFGLLLILGIVLVVYWWVAGMLLFFGEYDIGGKPNSMAKRLFYTIMGIVGIISYWYWLFLVSPFTIVVK